MRIKSESQNHSLLQRPWLTKILIAILIGGCATVQFPYPYLKPTPEQFYKFRLNEDKELPFFSSKQQAMQTYQKILLGKGSAADEFAIGIAYLQGVHLDTNEGQAIYWLRNSAAKQFPAAIRYLGFVYMYGIGVPMDFSQVVFWFSKAADLGDSEAMWILGSLYEEGYGIPKDRSKGLYLINQSIKLGNQNARNYYNALIEREKAEKRNLQDVIDGAQGYMPPGH